MSFLPGPNSVGGYQTATLASASAVSLTTNTAKTPTGCSVALSPGEYDRHRARILDHLACGSEQPRCSVYSKCDNGVAQLVGRVEKVPRWIQTNEAWNAALRGLPSNRGKQSVCRIGSVHSHAVVATIGAIYKATVR